MQLTQAILVLCRLSLHVDRALARLLERAGELEHALVLEADLGARAVDEAGSWGCADLQGEVVRTEARLLELCGQERGVGDGERLKGGRAFRGQIRDEDQL